MLVFDETHADSSLPTASYLRILSVERFKQRKKMDNKTRVADSHTILFSVKGNYECHVDKKPILLPEYYFLLIEKGHLYGFRNAKSRESDYYLLRFENSEETVSDFLCDGYLMGTNLHISDLFYHLNNATLHGTCLSMTKDAILVLILEQCLSSHRGSPKSQQLFLRFCRYVSENMGSDLSADTISAALNYNKDYLSRTVKRFSGRGLKEYVVNEKMGAAKTMLSTTDASINEIAKCLGFSSPELFIKSFRYYTHMTPLEFRRQNIK